MLTAPNRLLKVDLLPYALDNIGLGQCHGMPGPLEWGYGFLFLTTTAPVLQTIVESGLVIFGCEGDGGTSLLMNSLIYIAEIGFD